MFQLSVETSFCAAHAIVIRGEREPLHGHTWLVTLRIGADTLDQDGLVCDFHAVEHILRETVAPFHNRNLNEVPPFDTINPTAELVAQHIGDTVAKSLPQGVHLVSCAVTEAPGCIAIYQPMRSA